MISYIVSDFDGTLIGKDRQVSPAVAAAIKKYLSQGGTFSIATGRAYEGLVQETVTKYSLSQVIGKNVEVLG